MKALSLFSSAGIGEYYLKDIGIEVVMANELLKKRADVYKYLYPDVKMLCGDIKDVNIKKKMENICETNNIELLLATPPCQGMSIAGKNKNEYELGNDERNYLVFEIMELIKKYKFNYILIENVPRFLKMLYFYENESMTIIDILKKEFSDEYIVRSDIFDSSKYGVAQKRKRAIIRMYKKKLKWDNPLTEKEVTVFEAIGHLPSLESGEKSNIKYHYARKHCSKHIRWMQSTPTGCTAFDNKINYPVKKDGTRIKGFKTCYKRINWDKPAPTITIRSDAISSQNNVHPGHKKDDGTWSDARVLTLKEIFLLSSLPDSFNLPDYLTDNEIRQLIGESIPPKLLKKIMEGVR